MSKITPFLWFENQAEQAANFYVSVFKDGKIGKIVRWGDQGPGPKGSVLTVQFDMHGQSFTALNGGPQFKFNEAVSFVIHCDDQKEVDYYWEKLIAGGGAPSQCGWLKDKFGLSWQVVPKVLFELLSNPDPAVVGRVTAAFMPMQKFDIATLEKAAANK
jgi:predicted 3-demethylubiquinone-9 3-methyltransferase (glyoxalase superfamily)